MSDDEETARRRERRRRRKEKAHKGGSDEEPEVEHTETTGEDDSDAKRRRRERRRRKNAAAEDANDDIDQEEVDQEDSTSTRRERRRRKKQLAEEDEQEVKEEEEGDEDTKKKRKKKRGKQREKDNGDEDNTVRRHQTTAVGNNGNKFNPQQLLGDVSRVFTRGFRNPPKVESPQFRMDFRVKNPVLMVAIHGTDQLSQDPYVSHPVVKLHVVNSQTGQYLEKANSDVPAVSLMEQQTKIQVNRSDGLSVTRASDACQYITPMMTEPCNLGSQGRHGAKLSWNDERGRLLFGEPYATVLAPEVLFLFEVLDFVPGAPLSKLRDGKGWYRIAWGFLHAVGLNGTNNIPKSDSQAPRKLRLQLYRHTDQSLSSLSHARTWHKKNDSKGGLVPDVYFSYLAQKRVPYPSTLYTTITGVRAPGKERVERRPILPTEKERHKLSFAQAIALGEVAPETKHFNEEMDEKAKRVLRRSRGSGEACLVPDTVSARIPCGNGCFALAFSHSGKYLAAACREDHQYPIRIYEVDTGNSWPWGEFAGHHAIVYTVKWMAGDKMLASASGDGTVRLWSTPTKAWIESSVEKTGNSTTVGDPKSGEMTPRTAQRTAAAEASARVVTLVHNPPTYIYSAAFHPMADPPVVVSAAYDGHIRVWDARAADEFAHSKSERFKGTVQSGFHKTRVNCVMFDKRGLKMFSADALGIVVVWRCHGDLSDPGSYTMLKRLDVVEGKPIHSIDFCREHLLVHAEQNILRIIELKKYQHVHEGLSGAQCNNANIGSCFSADGRWVLSGSEDGCANVWYTKSSATYKNPLSTHRYGGRMCGVAWHATQHVVALCSYDDNAPILLLEADRDKLTIGQLDQAMSLPEQSLVTKDGELDETAVFDGVELTATQKAQMEEKREKRRKEFASSLRFSLQESNPALKRMFESNDSPVSQSLDSSLIARKGDGEDGLSAVERIRRRRMAKRAASAEAND
jgi:jouberin